MSLSHGAGDLPRFVEIRGYKWPHRPQNAARVHVLGEDEYGRWLGAAEGEPWWSIDGARRGVFITPVVKLVPTGTFWTACFQPVDPVVDVDIVLPPTWKGAVLEEIDLELDIVMSGDGRIRVRDREEWNRVRALWPVPEDLVATAEETCARILAQVEKGCEPFGSTGGRWLEQFMAEGDRRPE